MTEFRIQNSELRTQNDDGEPILAPRGIYLKSEFCILNSVIFAVAVTA